jgi:hypothetical protein
VKFDSALLTSDLAQVPALARELETTGYDGAFSFEGQHEPFLPLLLAAEHAPRLEIATGLAIALAATLDVRADLRAETEDEAILRVSVQVVSEVGDNHRVTRSQPIGDR